MLRARAAIGTQFKMPWIAWSILVSFEMQCSRCGNWYCAAQGHPWGTGEGSCPGPQPKHRSCLATSAGCPRGACPCLELPTTFAAVDMALRLSGRQHPEGCLWNKAYQSFHDGYSPLRKARSDIYSLFSGAFNF